MPSGSCFCNAVRYNYTGEIQKKAVCHCLDCRKISGSAYSTNILVPSQGFELTTGKPKTIAKTADSGKTITSYFCGDCGSTLWRETATFGDNKIIKAGSLDDVDALDQHQPEIELFDEHKVKWSSVDVAGQ
ncbi:hypothetical protein AMS68_006895 [Peltaster fructicola]|uniref:CENP-V/GFA domain-containing protein n=1 Tax=Peltaster fructicola TaxID=286661 RepID=A0A6H0Y3G2_9PEZI|nr:hypothetical protein AMS68_006895 [Peltaster fructicola]